MEAKQKNNILIIAAFLAVYLIWGSTYLGIRIAVATMPPFLITAIRFLVAGTVLYGVARIFGAKKPTLQQWKSAMVIGICLTVMGNGFVVFAE